MQEAKQNINILIVDDEDSIRLLLRRICDKPGHNIFEAKNGKGALMELLKSKIDLAIVDLNMEVMNGLTFIKEAQRIRPSLDIAVLSGYLDDYALAELKKLGIKNIFRKPLKIAELSKYVDEYKNTRHNQPQQQDKTHYIENFAAISNILGYLTVNAIKLRPIKEIWQEITVMLIDIMQAHSAACLVKEETGTFLFFNSASDYISADMLTKMQEEIVSYFTEVGGQLEKHDKIELIGKAEKDLQNNNIPLYSCKVPIIRASDVRGVLMINFTNESICSSQGILLYHIAHQISLLIDTASLFHDSLSKDQLTNLATKSYFIEQIKHIQQMAIREGFPLAMVFIDIDKFKEINDTYGHKFGDIVLKEMAQIISSITRSEDIVARMGGDEFAVILPGCDSEGYVSFALRLLNAVRDKIFCAGSLNLSLTVSIGIAWFSAIELHHRKHEEIIDAADKTMYYAKKNGGNTAAIYGRDGIDLLDDISSIDIRQKFQQISFANNLKCIEDFLLSLMALRMDVFGYHSLRTGKIAEIFGKHLGIKDDELKTLSLAGLFHDIGKIAIPSGILNKPAALDQDEWFIVQKHSEIGYHILSPFKLMDKIAEIVLQHHERFDGKGYPNGLKGEHILYYARIVTLADAYDVMRSKRPYTDVWAADRACSEINKQSGTQFDPILTEKFLECIPKIEKDIYPKDKVLTLRL